MVAFTIISLRSAVAERVLAASAGSNTILRQRGQPDRPQTRHIARTALCALVNRKHPGDWEFYADARGKLLIKSRRGEPGPNVSISHTRGWVACAVAEHPVGIDIETHRERDHPAIAEYAFGPRENALVRRDGVAAFYRIWTVREAIGKATGEGLTLVTDGHDHADGGAEGGRWTASTDGGTWLLAHLRPGPSVSAAIALLSRDVTTWAGEPFEEIQADALM